MREDFLKFIFGIKVKRYRKLKNLSFAAMAHITGLSQSYLSEIEKGSKYPKPEKISHISEALGVPFDELVTTKLSGELEYVGDIINSPIWTEFPFEQFGLMPADIFKILTEAPTKAIALIQTLIEMGRSFNMQSEHFLLATLRSFQVINHNHFPEIEQEAAAFSKEAGLKIPHHVSPEHLEVILKDKFKMLVDYETIGKVPNLLGFRSILADRGEIHKLMIHPKMDPQQRSFLILKEMGYRFMEIQVRAKSFSAFNPHSFDQVYNNFRSSYFAGAVQMPLNMFAKDIRRLFGMTKWDADMVLKLITDYSVSPETFIHRISQILLPVFNFEHYHFMRFTKNEGQPAMIDKELNTTDVFFPRGVSEHHCSRWLSKNSLDFYTKEVEKNHGKSIGTKVYVQRSRFIKNKQEFFNISVCRELNTTRKKFTSMTLGILIDESFMNQVGFWNDPSISRIDVNETCERCPLTEEQCKDRKSAPLILEKEKHKKEIQATIDSFTM